MLYRQSGKIEIVVTKDDVGALFAGARGENAGEINSNKEETPNDEQNKRAKSPLTTRQARLHSIHAIGVAKQAAFTVLRLEVNNISRVYGDQARQEIANRQIEVAQDVINPISNASMAMFAGLATGSPVSGLIGASLSLTASTLTMASKYIERQREYNIKVAKENNAIEYKKARAHINLTSGRLR